MNGKALDISIFNNDIIVNLFKEILMGYAVIKNKLTDEIVAAAATQLEHYFKKENA